MAIPCMLPMPAAGIMAQSVPTVAADSVIDPEWDAAWWEAAGAAAGVELPQAVAVAARAPAIRPAANRRDGLDARARFDRMVFSCSAGAGAACGAGHSSYSSPEAAWIAVRHGIQLPPSGARSGTDSAADQAMRAAAPNYGRGDTRGRPATWARRWCRTSARRRPGGASPRRGRR